jgi:hypothetical protein
MDFKIGKTEIKVSSNSPDVQNILITACSSQEQDTSEGINYTKVQL